MTEKLIKQRVPAIPPGGQPGRMITAPYPASKHHQGQLVPLIGPAIGFVLAAALAISFALALAGGAGEAALGGSHGARPARMAVFVL
ncbi:MAG: hypothetical protein PHT60_08770 [Acidiphilium sp.]|nr:hypothetical protein [Acidiphilium sp.]MDD4935854.1 hypothetical protein [Acidiphilium sp.]